MSKRTEALVWDRSRAGKSDLLMLVKIADLADDDGRNAWPEIPMLAKWTRSSLRGALYILHRLEGAGEIEIDHNDAGREIVLRGGRRFRPKWFIHVRCVCAWDAYQTETRKDRGFSPGAESAKLADSVSAFRRGRPTRRKMGPPNETPDRNAQSLPIENPQSFPSNPNGLSAKSAKSRHAYKERSVSDPVVEQVQGAALPKKRSRAGASPRPHLPVGPPQDRPADHLAVITKVAHEVLDLVGTKADLGELTDSVKCRCASLRIAYDADVVRKAVDSALHQRQRKVSA